MPTVLLARHGETMWNREGRLQGWAPTPLTDRGHRQAQALGSHLAATRDVDRVLASDLRRTRQTASHVGTALGRDPVHEPDWRERDYGCYQGLLAEDFFERYPEYSLVACGSQAVREQPPGGESCHDLRDRVVARWRSLRASLEPGETVLVVAHGGTIKTLLGHLRDQPLAAALSEQPFDNCGLATVDVAAPDSPADDAVVAANETGFLDADPDPGADLTLDRDG